MLSAVDASALQTGEPSQLAVFRTQLIDSLVSHGFIRLINHGIPEHQIDEVFEQVCRDYWFDCKVKWLTIVLQSKNLFQLPWESKTKLANDPEKSDYQRGWSALGDEQTWALFGQEGVFGSKESSDSKVGNEEETTPGSNLTKHCKRKTSILALQGRPASPTSGRPRKTCQASRQRWRPSTAPVTASASKF